jgi:hypothetical protein
VACDPAESADHVAERLIGDRGELGREVRRRGGPGLPPSVGCPVVSIGVQSGALARACAGAASAASTTASRSVPRAVTDRLQLPGGKPCQRSYFCQTEMCLLLRLVNGSRVQSLQRSRSVIPARRAIRSSSDGHTYLNGIERFSNVPPVPVK